MSLKRPFRIALLAALIPLLLSTLNVWPVRANQTPSAKSVPANEIDSSYAVEWMNLLYDRVEAEAVNAPAAARIYGYGGMALYESVWFGIPGNYSMAGRVNGLGDLPYPDEDTVYDWVAVADGTLSVVIPGLLPGKADTQKAVMELRAKQIADRQKATSEEILTRSVTLGEKIGKGLMEWIADDNYADTREATAKYVSPAGKPELWVPTTPGTKAAEPLWGQLRPLALGSSDQCNVYLNMPYSTDPNSSFYAQANEVKTVGDNLTSEQRQTADFWVDTPGQTGAPAGHWMSIVGQVVTQRNIKFGRAAEAYGLVGIAVADSFISCWQLKYQVNLVRPETYIKQNIRKSWNPYIQTPPFPEYPSGHSVVSSAAAEVLTGMFGTVAFKDDTHRKHNQPSRSFTSFQAAATEAAISRLYGGIHYRAAIEGGLRQGQCVGQRVLTSVVIRQRPQGAG